jgi:hypothetical protein
MGTFTDSLAITPVATLSTGYFSEKFTSHFQSIASHSPLTTLQRISDQTQTLRISHVDFTISHCLKAE